MAAQLGRVTEQLEEGFPAVAELLERAAPDVTAFAAFPVEHWRQVWSNNPQERLNREIRRRTDVVGIFPNREAVIRLTGMVLAEQHNEWAVGRSYMSAGSLAKLAAATGGRARKPRGGDGSASSELSIRKADGAETLVHHLDGHGRSRAVP